MPDVRPWRVGRSYTPRSPLGEIVLHCRPHWSTLLAPLVLLALLAAACGGGDDDASGTASDGNATTGDGAAEIDPDGSFTYAYPLTLSRMDPHKANISQDAVTLYPAYDRLVHLAPDGELIPGLAESWEFSDDVRTVTMHLREGVTFHDGAVFDAEAAKKNLDRAKTIEDSSVTSDVSTIESVDVVDEHTIRLNLNVANASILGVLADRAGIQVSPKALDEGVNLDEEMVGAGPFRMVSHTPGASTTFERFESYWGEPARVKTLEIKVMPDAVSRLNALRSQEVDGTTIGANQVAELEGDESVNLQFNTELLFYFITQNRTRAHQDDLRVRQAMVHALDREGICDTLMRPREGQGAAGRGRRREPRHRPAHPGRSLHLPGAGGCDRGPVARGRHQHDPLGRRADAHQPDGLRGHRRRHPRRVGRPRRPVGDLRPAHRGHRLQQPRWALDAEDGRALRGQHRHRRPRRAPGHPARGVPGSSRVRAGVRPVLPRGPLACDKGYPLRYSDPYILWSARSGSRARGPSPSTAAQARQRFPAGTA